MAAKRKCLHCSGDIPSTRKKSSRYCGDTCYYEAKKNRSNNRYNLIKSSYDRIKKAEAILEQFFLLTELRKEILYDDLEKRGFDWGITTGESLGPNDTIWKTVGRFAYLIEPNKTVKVWKLKQLPSRAI
jgi:hypothetical protein